MSGLIREIITRSTTTNRLAWIDYVKGIAISMVVYRHVIFGFHLSGLELNPSLLYTTNIGLGFRMPLFFILSGIFFNKSIIKRGRYGYFLHKLKSIMYPYFIWSFIQISLQMLLVDYTNAQFTSLSDYLLILYSPRAQFWFLYALFSVSVVYLILSRFIKNKYILLLLGIILFYYAPEGGWGKPLNDVMRLFVFFVLGDLLSSTLLNQNNLRLFNSKILFTVLLLLTILGEWIILELNTNQRLIRLLFGIIGSTSIISVSFIFSSLKKPFLSFIRIIGFHSLYIFLLHAIFSAAFRLLFVNFFGIHNNLILVLGGTIVGILGPILFYNICYDFGLRFLFYPSFRNFKKKS